MLQNLYIPLTDRGVIAITGDDAQNYLQGIISNDITKASHQHAIYALMLTPQGKFLYDFFILQINDEYILDCQKEHLPAIIKKLTMYKLRSDVTITDLTGKYEVVALIGQGIFDTVEHKNIGDIKQFCKGAAYIDPRTDKIYARSVIEKENDYQSFKAHNFSQGKSEDYEQLRISSNVPRADTDMLSEKSFPLHYRMDSLNAIDYEKGCYVGQEVTARMHHRGSIKKSLYVIETSQGNALPPPGSDILVNDQVVGQLLSSINNKALAILNCEMVEKHAKSVYKSEGLDLTICDV